MKNIRIGVDLDNTLVCYDRAFLWGAHQLELLPKSYEGNKRQIRDYLRGRKGGEAAWQLLQGQVYGRWVDRAKLFPGVVRFLWRCKQLGVTVEIVSHKSEYGHGDAGGISLREVALKFLEEAGVYSAESESLLKTVQFFGSRKEKIHCIAQKRFDWFIDDLEEIFMSSEFPQGTKKILFCAQWTSGNVVTTQADHWNEIENKVLGNWTEREVEYLAGEISGWEIVNSTLLDGGKNSRIARVETIDGSKAVLKFYSYDETHDRLFSDFHGSRLMRECGILNTPDPIGYSQDFNVAMFGWIDGTLVINPDDNCLDQALEFLGNVHSLRQCTSFEEFPNASATVFSGQDVENQLRSRFASLQKNTIESGELKRFLFTKLRPSIERLVSWYRSEWVKEFGYEHLLADECRTLSPSDFGFHNALRNREGEIIFIDFEYFGWDDPAKLVGDFVLHPGMNLTNSQKKHWIKGAEKIFGSIMLRRMSLMWPLLGLCWCLILLNDFRQDYFLRRNGSAGEQATINRSRLMHQLARSEQLLGEIQSQYKNISYVS